ncbi:MAG: adenosine kinase, partial [Sphingomonas sp.]
MATKSLDIVAIGNAIVDVIAKTDEAFIAAEGIEKGSMRLVDTETAEGLYSRMGPGIEASGGSAANTVAGIAALGGSCGFIGQVAEDFLGDVFTHDIRALGVAFDTAPRAPEPPTARCLILVTPDAQRTMNTFLGASQYLPETALDRALIASASILYLEGYLWDPEQPRAAMRAAIEIAKGAGRKVAFTLSDAFCIERHRADFR